MYTLSTPIIHYPLILSIIHSCYPLLLSTHLIHYQLMLSTPLIHSWYPLSTHVIHSSYTLIMSTINLCYQLLLSTHVIHYPLILSILHTYYTVYYPLMLSTFHSSYPLSTHLIHISLLSELSLAAFMWNNQQSFGFIITHFSLFLSIHSLLILSIPFHYNLYCTRPPFIPPQNTQFK